MSGVFYEFEQVDMFTTGAVGEPGSRTFYLQAQSGRRRVAVKCEKQQVAAIVGYLRRVLNDLPPPEERPLDAALKLRQPVDAEFVLGPIGLGYDRSSDRIVVQLEELGKIRDDAEDGDEETLAAMAAAAAAVGATGEGQIRLYVTRGQAQAFCDHAEAVIAAGRPDCEWCGLPIDPTGHACPRMN